MRGLEEEASLAGLTIRTSSLASSSSKKGKDFRTNNASDSSPSIKNSPLHSPSLVSPPSSAFVSALQSPYISPRTTTQPITTTTTHKPSPPVSYRGSQSEDVPSSSYTPPSDQYELSDDPSDRKLKLSACMPDHAPPRISFSFPVPRVSLAKASVSSP